MWRVCFEGVVVMVSAAAGGAGPATAELQATGCGASSRHDAPPALHPAARRRCARACAAASCLTCCRSGGATGALCALSPLWRLPKTAALCSGPSTRGSTQRRSCRLWRRAAGQPLSAGSVRQRHWQCKQLPLQLLSVNIHCAVAAHVMQEQDKVGASAVRPALVRGS